MKFVPTLVGVALVNLVACSATGQRAPTRSPTSAASATWTPLAPPQPMHDAALVPLRDGRLLIAGGTAGGYAVNAPTHSTVQVFDPAHAAWSTTPTPLPAPPVGGPAAGAQLSDGRVLVVGERTAAVLDAQGRAWTAVALPTPDVRAGVWVVALSDGRAMVGLRTRPGAFVFEPARDAFRALADVPAVSEDGSVTALADGRVLTVSSDLEAHRVVRANVIDPATGGVERGPEQTYERVFLIGQSALGRDGRAFTLVSRVNSGAGPSHELLAYDPRARAWSVSATPATLDNASGTVQLPDGRMLVLLMGSPGTQLVLYDPGTDAWSTLPPLGTPPPSAVPRLAALSDGRVVLVGDTDAILVALPPGSP